MVSVLAVYTCDDTMHDFLLIIQTLNAFFLGTSADITSQMTALHEQTDWPCATSAAAVRELQSSETQTSEALPIVTGKQSEYWNYILGIWHSM